MTLDLYVNDSTMVSVIEFVIPIVLLLDVSRTQKLLKQLVVETRCMETYRKLNYFESGINKFGED